MTWASIFATVAVFAFAAGCADRAAIPPGASPEVALAQSALGELYARGLGVELDYGAAASWFGRAAMNGNVSAQISSSPMLPDLSLQIV
jgi:TPR repeat protein